MKKLFILFIVLGVTSSAFSQYYYQDILGTDQTNKQYATLVSKQLKKVSAISYEQNSEPSKDFVLEQTVSNNGREIITRSATSGSGESFFKSSYENNKLIKTVDSGTHAINTVTYTYNSDGKLLQINSVSKDFDGSFTTKESHTWAYNSKGKPERMLKVKNEKDTTRILFSYDEFGNVAEERWTKNNRTLETYYYYYNANNQLTDIVRFNRKAKQMLPDYMFEYDTEGHITSMTQTQSTSANYLVWKYQYNPQGLKAKEYVFNKQKELLGRIEYNYQ
ncbi:MAG: hypothetical protein JWQ96_195 [Segetibacter sp.]|nr:hypothetical protein [Segetibacter sp.]